MGLFGTSKKRDNHDVGKAAQQIGYDGHASSGSASTASTSTAIMRSTIPDAFPILETHNYSRPVVVVGQFRNGVPVSPGFLSTSNTNPPMKIDARANREWR